MNFRELVADLKREAGRMGAAPAEPASSSFEDAKLWQWIAEAWRSLQNDGTPWAFCRETRTVNVLLGQALYEQADFGGPFADIWPTGPSHDEYRPSITDGSVVSELSDRIDYEIMRRTQLQPTQPGRPQLFAVDPGGRLLLAPSPDKAYTLSIDVIRAPHELVDPSDEPLGLPVWHHKLLVWRALEPLAYDDAAPELLTRAVQESGRAIRRLADEQGPKIRIAWGRR